LKWPAQDCVNCIGTLSFYILPVNTVQCSLLFFTGTTNTHTHTHLTALKVSRYQKGKINLDFTEARDSEWQWHQLGHMQVCISLQTDNHDSTTPLCFLQAGCPSCRPTSSVKALKARVAYYEHGRKTQIVCTVFTSSLSRIR